MWLKGLIKLIETGVETNKVFDAINAAYEQETQQCTPAKKRIRSKPDEANEAGEAKKQCTINLIDGAANEQA